MVELIAWFAIIFGLLQLIPMIVESFCNEDKELPEYSFFILTTISSILWAIYAWGKEAYAISYYNMAYITLASILLSLKLNRQT